MLAKRDFAALIELCGVDKQDFVDMIDEIRSLDPRPAGSFDFDPVQSTIPDVFINQRPDGSYAAELNPEAMPKALVNQTYKAIIIKNVEKEDEKLFVTEALQNANWLVKALQQRSETILKVVAEIIRHQDSFFVHGIRHLKPLSRKQIADEVGVHESTISRATNNKFAMTNRGVFELKYFFSAAVSASEGKEDFSVESVRQQIRDLIDSESMDTVLSDDMIVEALSSQGVEIARRTVAKYRESMNIPSSVKRRREKRALAISF